MASHHRSLLFANPLLEARRGSELLVLRMQRLLSLLVLRDVLQEDKDSVGRGSVVSPRP